jgi:hypothetical protein
LPVDWRDEVPDRWQPIVEYCVEHFQETGIEVTDSTDLVALAQECERIIFDE